MDARYALINKEAAIYTEHKGWVIPTSRTEVSKIKRFLTADAAREVIDEDGAWVFLIPVGATVNEVALLADCAMNGQQVDAGKQVLVADLMMYKNERSRYNAVSGGLILKGFIEILNDRVIFVKGV